MNPQTQTTEPSGPCPAAAYYNAYSVLPLRRLISGYARIELDLLDDLKEDVNALLPIAGFKRHGDLFTMKGHVCRPTLDLMKGQRTLCVNLTLQPAKGTQKSASKEITVFGLIRSVIVCGSAPLTTGFMREMCDTLANRLTTAYAALEAAFLHNYQDLEREVFRKLYGVLHTHLLAQGKEHLFGRIWFFIAEPDVGFFYFDPEVLQRVIKHYKANQTPDMSPFELTAWIMSEPLPFDKTLSLQSLIEGRPLSLEWTKARFHTRGPADVPCRTGLVSL